MSPRSEGRYILDGDACDAGIGGWWVYPKFKIIGRKLSHMQVALPIEVSGITV